MNPEPDYDPSYDDKDPHSHVRRARSEKISVSDLLHSVDYLRSDHPQVQLAFGVGKTLQGWFDDRYQDGPGQSPMVSLDICHPCVTLSIGDVVVWDSENDDTEALSRDRCLQRYRDHLTRQLAPFLAESEGEAPA